jgi:biofilm protein TabA
MGRKLWPFRLLPAPGVRHEVARMALFGSLATIRTQLASTPGFSAALTYVEACLRPGSEENRRVHAVASGTTERVELGDGVFALEQAYVSKPRAEGRWESHRAYIDVQVIVSGEEIMEVTDIGALQVEEDLTPGKDVLFYRSFDQASVLRVKAGEIGVFFPVDAHLPSLAVTEPALVRKTVVKVPVGA